MSQMYSIGLTGGIGSGKSRVADLLQAWGAAVIDTDQISHTLTGPGGAAIAALRASFGAEVINTAGALDRAAMRRRVFADPAQRQRLEAILHPLIKQETVRLAREAQGCYVVYVVPLLVESDRWRRQVDRVCVVDCDPPTQIARVQSRSALAPDDIRRIMAVQASRAERLARADDVIVNDGATPPDLLTARARAKHDEWCKQAASRPAL